MYKENGNSYSYYIVCRSNYTDLSIIRTKPIAETHVEQVV